MKHRRFMDKTSSGLRSAIIALTIMLPGCTKVLTGEYAIRGHEVNSLTGTEGSGRPIEIGRTDAAEVRRKLGSPLIRYEGDSTDIFDASPRYRWVLNLWPVALSGQSGPSDPHVLLRVDYGENGLVAQTATTQTFGPETFSPVPYGHALARAWPDLSTRKVSALDGE